MLLLSVVDQEDLGYRLGAADYLMKPFERDDLLAAHHGSPRAAAACWWSTTIHVADLKLVARDRGHTRSMRPRRGSPRSRRSGSGGPTVILLDLLMPRMHGFELIAICSSTPSGVTFR